MYNSRAIGILVNARFEYSRGVLKGIKKFFNAHAEFRPNLLNSLNQSELTDVLKIWLEEKPSGVVASIDNAEQAKLLRKLKVPIVNVGNSLPDITFPRIGVDDVAIGHLAAEHLADLGLKNFAFSGRDEIPFIKMRLEGFSKGLATRSLLPKTLSVFPAINSLAILSGTADSTPMLEWIRSLPKPVGVMAANDIVGAALVNCARNEGLRVPEDFAVIGVDNDEFICDFIRPALSSIALPTERIGIEAAQLLKEILEGKKPPATLLFSPSGIVARQSTDLLEVADPEVAMALRYIRENAGRNFMVDEVVEKVSISHTALLTKFKAVLGRTLLDEIRRVHLERAKWMLTKTDQNIAAIAAQSGFPDPQWFSVVFRRQMGMTPSQYREKTFSS